MADIILGNLKFYWAGDWTPATQYDTDDVVKYGPSVYVCIDGHTSDSTFATDLAKWDLMVAGLENAGEWNTSTLYKYGQTVTYGGAVYIALRENTNANPYTSANDWAKFVDGQQFEGEWSSANNYQKGDIIFYGGYLYVANQNTQANNPTESLFWSVFSKGFLYKGEWNSSTQYKPGEVVEWGGNRYVCNEGLRPLANNPGDIIYWTKILEGFNWTGDYFAGDNDFPATEYKPGDIVKYGSKLYKCISPATGIAPDVDDTRFELFLDGMRWAGQWDQNTSYYAGDVTRLGGRAYVCINSYENDGSTLPEPPNPDYWELLIDGFMWNGVYNPATEYEQGDVVEYAQSSYISVNNDNVGNQPDIDDGTNWNLVAQGDSNAVIAQRGDILVRGPVQADRLPIGPAGSTLQSDGTDVFWGHTSPLTEYYVSLEGSDSNDGRTPNTSWRTLEHACNETYNSGQVKINIAAGVYEELTPIKIGRSVVVEGNGLGAVTISPDNTNDKGYGVGISKDGSTPNANSFVFQVNNGSRLRNVVFRNFSTGAVCVSLDPGTGPDDTSVWITSQSPYVQNCTSFTPEGTGMLIDGALHNGGYKSAVANDWTQINSDGIGIHVKTDARVELVSVFTYYCNIGYLAESGGKIRALVGNNSYGEYGAVARGFSQAETPLPGRLQLTDDTINSVQQVATDVHIFTSYRDFQGNVYAVGHTNPTGTDVTSTFDNTASYPAIVKWNSAGSLDWIYTYESNFGAIHNIVEVVDSLYAVGVINDGANKGFVMKISKNGEIQWQRTVGDTTELVDIATDGTNTYVVGNHVSAGVSATKLTASGQEVWSTTLGSAYTVNSCAFAGTPTTSVDTYANNGDATAERNLYIAVRDSGNSNSAIIRLDSVGNLVATYDYGDVFINDLYLDRGNGDGIYLVAGGYYDAGAVNKRPLTFRISVDGTVQWQRNLYLNTEEGEITDVLAFGDVVYAVGYLNDNTNTNNRGLVIKYSSNGVTEWFQYATNGTNNIAFNGVALDGVNVIVSGIENGNSVLMNIQRTAPSGNSIGTATVGSYIVNTLASSEGSDTVVTKASGTSTTNSIALGLTDTTLTLNQQPGLTRTIAATRPGFAGIGTGVNFTVSGLARKPKEGSVVQIEGDDETYFCIGVDNYIENFGQNADNNPNAVAALTNNRTWIQTETIGWITDQIANATPGSIWENFTYDQVKCSRDVGLIVDALVTDLDSSTLGSFEQNDASIDAALSYWSGYNNLVAGQEDQTIAAINYMKGLVDNAMNKTSPAQTYGGETQNTTHSAIETGTDTFAADRVDIITDVIANGPTAAPAVIASGTASIALEPAIPSNKTPDDDTPLVFREAFSQVRMTGHDFLDIGTGGFADTNYPVIIQADYTQQPSQDRETDESDGGRVFYVTTDQDGNFRVGNYFKVEQATGRATLSSEEFDLSGLNELQLGSITAGRQGATINEFSTDGTFADNSDTSVPTERAVVTYVTNQISELSENIGTIQVGADPNKTLVEVSGVGSDNDVINLQVGGDIVSQIGHEYMLVPKGSTANRPGTPANGYLRYNTDLNIFEGYVNGNWSGIGGGNPWITKTDADSPYTATNNDRIFVDTSSAQVTIVLPSTPNVGDAVRIMDLAGTFETNSCIVDNNGNNINGTLDTLTVNVNDAGLQLVYTGATYGWKLLEV